MPKPKDPTVTVPPEPLADTTNSTVAPAPKRKGKRNAQLDALEARVRQECQAQLDLAVARERAEAAERLAEKEKQIATMNRIRAEADEQANHLDTVPRPHGSSGRNYCLATVMGLENNKATYNEIVAEVHSACKEAKVDMTVSYRRQPNDKILKVCRKVREKRAFMTRFQNDWPVQELMKNYLKHNRDYDKKRAKSVVAQQAAHPLPAAPRRVTADSE